MTIDDRWNLIKSHKICANCLRKGHFPNSCSSNSTCKSCQKRHHTSLHRFYPINSNVYNSVRQNSNSFANTAARSENLVEARDNIQLSTTCQQNFKSEEHTLLSTALIKVKNAKGHFVNCRALIDNGSQKSLVSKNCVKRLQLSKTVTNHSISGINNTLVKSSLSEVSLVFSPHFNENIFCCKALIVDCITSDLPNFTFSSCNWPHLHGLMLADPTFHATGPIDILLGADLYADLLIGEPILGKKGTPAALNSHLGWLLSGRVFSNSNKENSFVNCHLTSSLDCQLAKFWELESLPQAELKSKNDSDCEAFYEKTVARDPSGRYIVRIPFKHSIEFGDSATQASKRFNYIERKLSKNNELEHQYTTFMSEYLQLGHMERVPSDELIKESTFYLPHHFVIKEDSNTTKLRVVFDASAKDSSGNSLNNALHAGPRLQPELFSLLLKFRTFKVAFTADIEKMFRQIRIHEEDADYQRILWRFKPDEEIQIYRLLTVTYGTACAPYLAVKTLQQLAKDEEKAFPDASRVLKEEFYVDDLLSGTDSIPNAKNLVSNLKSLLQRGGFNLRKWSSNCSEVLSDLSKDSLSQQHNVTIEENQCQKVLGLYWNTQQDTFQVNISFPEIVTSKRELLSVIARIFDPLGFLSPATIILKILMQSLWKNKLTWDEPLTEELLCVWKTFQAEKQALKEIAIQRRLVSANNLIIDAQRFINNAKTEDRNRLSGRLQCDELTKSLSCIIKQIQQVHFKPKILSIEANGTVPKNSRNLSLSPFLDSDKILRLGGRLKHSELSINTKHPMLLPKSHHVTKLLIEYYHKLSLHAGTSVVLSLMRQKFWFISGRDTVRKTLRNCLTCLKINATPSSQLMGDLPRERVTLSRTFQLCGIDFAGPVITKPNLPRSKITMKSYIALFICLTTKAVHLELVSILSTEAFLTLFRRFIAGRGLPSVVFSDNATYFKGAQAFLKSLYSIVRSNSIQDFAIENQIHWHNIPPLSPHFGGLWEANIKSTKRHLIKVCGSATLNFEELTTLLTQIQSCLNSRPLCPLSSEPQDFEAPTPGHFIIGAPLLAISERETTPAMSLKSRWMLVQRLKDQFWSQWSNEYLHTLQTRSKWTGTSTNVAVGDLVLLKTDWISTPLKWTSARILRTFPGSDGLVRVVEVKTSNGQFTRSIAKICPLPKN
ncbi:uncharacterized protein [Parasteatoda tepidariorum]|uniref:uncharacterized protein n=1 Tax=Parasteatoda tepidariorum TaxID=114398 RepID=UPI0039BCF8CB